MRGIANAGAVQVTRAAGVGSTTLLRGGRVTEIGRELLWSLSHHRATRIRAELVSYGDAVEVEVSSDRTVLCRWRFVRDGAARAYSDRARRELEHQGYRRLWREPDEG